MPGVVDMFCNQQAQWEKLIPGSEDMEGNAQYEAPVDIKVRAVKKRQIHMDAMGGSIPTTWAVISIDKVDIGDRLTVNGETFTILAPKMSNLVWVDGQEWGRCIYG